MRYPKQIINNKMRERNKTDSQKENERDLKQFNKKKMKPKINYEKQ